MTEFYTLAVQGIKRRAVLLQIRSILAVIAGLVAASAVMMVVETVNGRLLYPERAGVANNLMLPAPLQTSVGAGFPARPFDATLLSGSKA